MSKIIHKEQNAHAHTEEVIKSMNVKLLDILRDTEKNIQSCIDQTNLILIGGMIDSSSTILISPLQLLENELNRTKNELKANLDTIECI